MSSPTTLRARVEVYRPRQSSAADEANAILDGLEARNVSTVLTVSEQLAATVLSITQGPGMGWVQFTPVPLLVPEVSCEDLSWEQKYLYEISTAVSTGICTPELAAKKPGELHHTRWLTTGSRILRLYVASRRPTASLKNFANYVMSVYVPMWFAIKKQNRAEEGIRHLFNMIQLSCTLPPNMRKIVHESITINECSARNGYGRAGGSPRISCCAANPVAGPRSFRVPNINFKARDYTALIFWDKAEVFAPPVLSDISDEDLQAAISQHRLVILALACSTQAVERMVRNGQNTN
ncbi:hypothetical protein FOCC_FOCC012972 [Frankliniella occidentalis]|nr:hypothetical protein FOCC_FOCC012972 [Frankliniella occidentalis]